MIVFALALLTAASAAPTDKESVRVSISQKGLDFAEDIAFTMIDIIQKVAVQKLSLPNISTSSFKASNLKFAALNLGKPAFSTVPDVGLKWSSPSAHIRITGKWAVKTGWWWTDGHMTLDAKLKVEAIAGVTASNGKLATSAKGCGVHFNSFNLDLHNSFYTWIASLMEGSITPEIRSAVCNEVNTLLQSTINGVIASLPHDIPVADVMDVEIEADSNPAFKPSYFDVSARVQADAQGSDIVFPFSPSPIVSVMDTSHMACLLLSDYTLNTASYVALSPGKVVDSLPNQHVPATNPIMNTAHFKTSLPQLYTAYPDQAVVYKISNTRYPHVEFANDNVIINMPLDLTVQVAGTDVLTLTLSLTVNGIGEHNNNILSGEIKGVSHTTAVSSSTIGDISVDKIEDILDTILEDTVLPQINSVITTGVVLPIDQYVTLNQGVVESHDDFVKVCADITLTDFTIQELKKFAEAIVNGM